MHSTRMHARVCQHAYTRLSHACDDTLTTAPSRVNATTPSTASTPLTRHRLVGEPTSVVPPHRPPPLHGPTRDVARTKTSLGWWRCAAVQLRSQNVEEVMRLERRRLFGCSRGGAEASCEAHR